MRARTRQEIASLYGFGCVRTLTRRLKQYSIKLQERVLILPEKQIEIFQVLGVPMSLSDKEIEWVERVLHKSTPPQILKNRNMSNVVQKYPTLSNDFA